ncbi:hypothetical protein C497_14122 [Halalkalicoccus jeotgali B3]|uniref:Uncharacterized protein n=1 Tax=Halalkalicoccus jeotgali (strain DSM 18796 / CECT 7217 / JCM 14584 / KCTC 4019 / B3) TaxID=795797 RepID=D8J2Z2_HALJB|nr:hypothetical protein HacjB3_08580 [Halalkalicoccus jeotgali B3]ELY34882.1 hypothetical protein C497_14122 [Halalkalicoccus jeotgali B3]
MQRISVILYDYQFIERFIEIMKKTLRLRESYSKSVK